MKIGLCLSQISFQSGEFNHEFEKDLNKAKNNGSNAQALLRCVDEDTITFSEERLKRVKSVLAESETPSAKAYLNLIVETWDKLVKR